jgi:hypothetical protein
LGNGIYFYINFLIVIPAQAGIQKMGKSDFLRNHQIIHMKKSVIFLSIALIHFGLSVLIVPMTLLVAGTRNTAQWVPTIFVQTLVAATRILHFPIISQSWYSRLWFPGDWIRVPILINSLLWAGGIYFLVMVGKKIWGNSK